MFENEHSLEVLGTNKIYSDIAPKRGMDTFYVIARVICYGGAV